MATSRIPRAAPQKHKDFEWFLKGPLVESGWGAMAHLAPERDWRRATVQNRSFLLGFKGFLNKYKILMISIRSSFWGGMQKHKDFQWFSEVPRRQPAGMCAVHGQLEIWSAI